MDVRSGHTHRLTSGDFDHLRPTISPDGSLVAFIAHRDPDADRTVCRYLWTVPIGGGHLCRIGGGWGPITDIAWAPCGTRLAFIGQLMGDKGQDRIQAGIYVTDLAGTAPECLTEHFGPTLGLWVRSDFRLPETARLLEWTAHGIYFIASERGSAGLYRATAERIEQVVGGPRAVFSFSTGPGGQVAFCAQNAVHPGDVFTLDAGGRERQRSEVNQSILSGMTLSQPQHFTFLGTLGQAVDAWIMGPVPREEDRRYPLILATHRGAFGQAFFHEYQVLAAHGYSVLYCNHVGAQGYGQLYAMAQAGNWGGPDVDEMLRGVEAAVDFPYVDGARVGTIGLSAGGFYSNWLASRTDRFLAVVTEGSISNWTSMFGTSDLGSTHTLANVGGTPWEKPREYWIKSPLAHVEKVRARVLIIHAEEDYRCPLDQAEQWFQALRYLGRAVEFVLFRGESHDFSRTGRPVHRIERLRRILDWFDRHLRSCELDA
ncbi:MAG: S9 family peptidase [bacterium]|nr:S9 family peptidase [bacterium]